LYKYHNNHFEENINVNINRLYMNQYRLDMDEYRLDIKSFYKSIYVTKCKDLLINFFNFMYDYCEYCADNNMI